MSGDCPGTGEERPRLDSPLETCLRLRMCDFSSTGGWKTGRAVAICENRASAAAQTLSVWDRRCGHFGLRENVMMSGMRVLERLEELYAIGGGPGANRVGDSDGEQRAHDLAASWMREAGFEVEVDLAGNLVGRVGDARVWTGSHLDSVPQGGKFDGVLGVVAGIEAVERVGAGAVVAFRDEERGCVGSGAFVARRDSLPDCFLELHVEQGPVLERQGAPLGVVTAIAAMARGEQVFEGEAGHAGTTPMAGRNDALCAAAEYVLHVRDAAARIDGAVATVGRIEVEPDAVNVIPARVRLTVDARAPDRERLDALLQALELDIPPMLEPVQMADGPRAALAAEVERLGLPLVELPSGAGHDAAVLAAAGVPTGMLFVRSLNGGISHSPDELSSPEDVELAVEALAGAIATLTSSGP
jgi:acetylornithine deacetylase/succinyl-diaminopimelate desuccinylase-like protein